MLLRESGLLVLPWCPGVKCAEVDNRLTQSHQGTKEDHSGQAPVCGVTRAARAHTTE